MSLVSQLIFLKKRAIVLVWVTLEADSKTEIQVEVIYLGGDPGNAAREHGGKAGKGKNERHVTKQVAPVGALGASVAECSSWALPTRGARQLQ